MPRDYFDRGSKGEYSREMFVALRHRLNELEDYLASSALGDLGLIDPSALRSALSSGTASADDLALAETTLETERWARCFV